MSKYKYLLSVEGEKLLFEKYNHAFKMTFFIYKGISSNEQLHDYYLFEKLIKPRESKTLSEYGNTYNLLLNNLSTWQLLPKRENSIIATSNSHTATFFATPFDKTYGKKYVLIPDINSKLVIAPESDIWISFKKGLSIFEIEDLGSLTKFNELINEIFLSIGIVDFDTNWATFYENLGRVCLVYPHGFENLSESAKKIVSKLLVHKENLEEFFNQIFDPIVNGIMLVDYTAALNPATFPNNELWTENNCLLIEHGLFLALKNKS